MNLDERFALGCRLLYAVASIPGVLENVPDRSTRGNKDTPESLHKGYNEEVKQLELPTSFVTGISKEEGEALIRPFTGHIRYSKCGECGVLHRANY